MANISETMLKMVVEMATKNGGLDAQLLNMNTEVNELRQQLDKCEAELAERNKRINELERLLYDVKSTKGVGVLNLFIVLEWDKTVKYIVNLDNNDRRFVCHFMHQTLPENTPPSVIHRLDELTSLREPEGGGVDIQNNYGPVNGSITTQNVGPSTGKEGLQPKQLSGFDNTNMEED